MSVWVNGCFDLFHRGHMHLLKNASTLSGTNEVLIGVNTDQSITNLKGPERPIMHFDERCDAIRDFMEAMDEAYYIVPIEGRTCTEHLVSLKPRLVVKSGQWTLETMDQDERKAVESYGGEIRIIKNIDFPSTSEIIERCKKCPK